MASKGIVLGDGAVIKVGEGNDVTYFVYYNNSLSKLEMDNEVVLSRTTPQYVPAVSIENTNIATNRCVFLEEKDFTTAELEEAYGKPAAEGVDATAGKFSDAEKATHKQDAQVYLFFYDTKEIEFADGSNNCTIYAGLVVKSYKEITTTTVFDETNARNYKNFVGKVKYALLPVSAE